MIKLGVKNYFVCLKYIFTPLGTLFLGMVLGFSAVLTWLFPLINQLIAEINALSDSISLDFASLFESIKQAAASLDWQDPSAAISTLLSKEWQNDTLIQCINSLLGADYEIYLDSIMLIVENFVNGMAAILFLYVFCVVLGIFGGYFLTKFLVRRTIAKRAWWKFILVAFIDSILSATLVTVCLYLINLWSPSIIFTSLLSLLLFGAVSLIEAYFTYAYKKVKFKLILNPKNVLGLVATNMIVFVIALVITVIATFAIDILVGLIVGFALLEIALLTASMNAESYVKDVVEKQAVHQQK